MDFSRSATLKKLKGFHRSTPVVQAHTFPDARVELDVKRRWCNYKDEGLLPEPQYSPNVKEARCERYVRSKTYREQKKKHIFIANNYGPMEQCGTISW